MQQDEGDTTLNSRPSLPTLDDSPQSLGKSARLLSVCLAFLAAWWLLAFSVGSVVGIMQAVEIRWLRIICLLLLFPGLAAIFPFPFLWSRDIGRLALALSELWESRRREGSSLQDTAENRSQLIHAASPWRARAAWLVLVLFLPTAVFLTAGSAGALSMQSAIVLLLGMLLMLFHAFLPLVVEGYLSLCWRSLRRLHLSPARENRETPEETESEKKETRDLDDLSRRFRVAGVSMFGSCVVGLLGFSLIGSWFSLSWRAEDMDQMVLSTVVAVFCTLCSAILFFTGRFFLAAASYLPSLVRSHFYLCGKLPEGQLPSTVSHEGIVSAAHILGVLGKVASVTGAISCLLFCLPNWKALITAGKVDVEFLILLIPATLSGFLVVAALGLVLGRTGPLLAQGARELAEEQRRALRPQKKIPPRPSP